MIRQSKSKPINYSSLRKYFKFSFLFRIRADKEVILSAGSVNSPQILMLSGVGPKSELDKHKIPVIQDLKVGHNLQDHVALGGLTFLINKPDSITLDQVYSVGKIHLFISLWKKLLILKPIELKIIIIII